MRFPDLTTITFVTSASLATIVVTWSITSISAMAQTLTDPNQGTKTGHVSAGKSAETKHPMKSCPEFGPGFVRLPGSDTCIRIGGFVEGGVSGGNR